MKALIIGAAGFVGGHLIDHLQRDCGWSIVTTKLAHETIAHHNITVYDLDILSKDAIVSLLARERPDYIFHLAAQSSVALSWNNPSLTIDINIKGSVNLLDAVREIPDNKPRVLLIGSGEEYGRIRPEETPVTESNVLRPGNIYAATKACQSMIGKIYADAYGMDIIMVRAFNHIGPNQSPQFVVSDFCKQVAEIENGLKAPIIYVGNLSAKRDFTDVRDVVKAYSLLMEKGIAGETYNIGTGKAISIQAILNEILKLSNTQISVEVDTDKLRPVDVPEIEAGIASIRHLGWAPQIPLTSTIEETLNFWRAKK